MTGKYSFRAGAAKYKFWNGAVKYKVGPGARGQDQEPGNTNTLQQNQVSLRHKKGVFRKRIFCIM